MGGSSACKSDRNRNDAAIGGEDWLVRGSAVVKRIVIRNPSTVDEWPSRAVEWLALVADEVYPPLRSFDDANQLGGQRCKRSIGPDATTLAHARRLPEGAGKNSALEEIDHGKSR